jgi:precorrin-6A synthase
VRTVLVIGIGAGDPDHLTVEAARALNRADVVFVLDKGEDRADLAAVRREILARHVERPPRQVVATDPARELGGPSYRDDVAAWHEQRLAVYERFIGDELADDEAGAFLVWGDPALYDSTLRILDRVAEHVDIDYDVVPGVTAIQALTARHRIPLNDIGEPVLITTGRQLRENGLSGSAVVMLDADCSFQDCPPGTRIWWGAYLGTPDELLFSGTVGEVGARIAAVRADARAEHGWIMDTYLLRSAD